MSQFLQRDRQPKRPLHRALFYHIQMALAPAPIPVQPRRIVARTPAKPQVRS